MARAHQCLNEETILALAAGAYDEARASALLADAELCEECSILLGEAGRAVADDAGDETDTAIDQGGSRALLPGAVIAGRFRVLHLLGQGGMGEVYAASDTELGETVALKTIRPSLLASAPATIERFRQEARLARRVVHPNVCRVLEFGRDDAAATAPTYFLTMELLRGIPLSRHLRERWRLDVLEATDIVLQVSAGLCAIHREGVLHRDIKTSNIMLCPQRREAGEQGDERQRAVLLDFGVARGLRWGDKTTSSTGGQAGTPSYMAPEQLRGQELSTATDVYSLGVVLFELLTGKLPFGRAESRAAALEHLLLAPTPGESLATVPKRLAHLLERCLQRDPEQRLGSAQELERELDAVKRELGSTKVGASPAGHSHSRARLSKPPRSLRALTGAGMFGAGLLLVALGLAGTGVFRQQPPPTRHARATFSTSARPAAPPKSESESPPALAHAADPQRGPREPSPRNHRTPKTTASTAARPSATAAADCSPPYYFDDEGFRVYRRECL